MKRATYHGPAARLRLGDDGRILARGVPTLITEQQADKLSADNGVWSGHDVTIEPDPDEHNTSTGDDD